MKFCSGEVSEFQFATGKLGHDVKDQTWQPGADRSRVLALGDSVLLPAHVRVRAQTQMFSLSFSDHSGSDSQYELVSMS